MSGENQLKASDRLADHIKSIEEYINLTNVSYTTFNVEYIVAANLSKEDMGKMTTQEMFDTAYYTDIRLTYKTKLTKTKLH